MPSGFSLSVFRPPTGRTTEIESGGKEVCVRVLESHCVGPDVINVFCNLGVGSIVDVYSIFQIVDLVFGTSLCFRVR